MMDGDSNYFVCCLDYKVGIQAKIFDLSDIEEERTKPTTTKESFDYELIASSIWKKFCIANSTNLKGVY